MTTRQQALEYFESDDLIALGMAADAVRKQFHPEATVSYSLEPAAPGTTTALSFEAQASLPQIVERLEAARAEQERSGNWLAVLPRSQGTGVEHLKIVALTRIYLDNVPHVQTSGHSGWKLAQVSLRFGADDVTDVETGGPRLSEENLRRIIRDAGFIPKERDALFRVYSLA